MRAPSYPPPLPSPLSPQPPTHLHRVHAILLGGGHIEANFHERDLSIIILVELQRHLVLARRALGDVAEGDLKHRLLPNVKGEQLPCGGRRGDAARHSGIRTTTLRGRDKNLRSALWGRPTASS